MKWPRPSASALLRTFYASSNSCQKMRKGTYIPSLDKNRQRVRKLLSEHTDRHTQTHTHTWTFFFAIPSNRLRSLRSFIKLKRTHCNTIILCTLKSNDTCTELCMNIDIKPNGLTSVCGLFLLVTLSYFCKPCKILYWGCPSASA